MSTRQPTPYYLQGAAACRVLPFSFVEVQHSMHVAFRMHWLAIIRPRSLSEDERYHTHIISCVLLLRMQSHCLCRAFCITSLR